MEFSCSLHQVKLDKGNDCIVCNTAFAFRRNKIAAGSRCGVKYLLWWEKARKSSQTFHFIHQTRSSVALNPGGRERYRNQQFKMFICLPFFHLKYSPSANNRKKFHYNFNRRNIKRKCLLCFGVILLAHCDTIMDLRFPQLFLIASLSLHTFIEHKI